MDRLCYTLAIRQRTCQNGVGSRIENIYTNVTPNTIIPLSFGYSVTFISSTATYATIQISNPDMILNTIFNIPSGSYKIFDLPVLNGTLKVYIGATSINCEETIVCCSA